MTARVCGSPLVGVWVPTLINAMGRRDHQVAVEDDHSWA
jgi:hypothetical protein